MVTSLKHNHISSDHEHVSGSKIKNGNKNSGGPLEQQIIETTGRLLSPKPKTHKTTQIQTVSPSGGNKNGPITDL
jgi:hypothetical protein